MPTNIRVLCGNVGPRWTYKRAKIPVAKRKQPLLDAFRDIPGGPPGILILQECVARNGSVPAPRARIRRLRQRHQLPRPQRLRPVRRQRRHPVGPEVVQGGHIPGEVCGGWAYPHVRPGDRADPPHHR